MKKVVLSAAVCAMAFSANAEEAVQASAFNSVYAGLGIGGSFLKSSLDRQGTMKVNRFMGSVVLGGGKVFKNNAYAGCEFLADFMKNRKKSYGLDNFQMKGFIPQVDVKLGYAFRNNVLGYGKFGCVWSKATYNDGRHDHSKNKTSFALGLGAEKAFCRKFSTAVEADYNFGFKWDNNGVFGFNNLRVNKGWTVRALAKCNVKY